VLKRLLMHSVMRRARSTSWKRSHRMQIRSWHQVQHAMQQCSSSCACTGLRGQPLDGVTCLGMHPGHTKNGCWLVLAANQLPTSLVKVLASNMDWTVVAVPAALKVQPVCIAWVLPCIPGVLPGSAMCWDFELLS
jgi:hypothetical protein